MAKYRSKVGRKFGKQYGIHESHFMGYCTEAQYHSKNIADANLLFKEGCDICSSSFGFRTECERCPIAYANRRVVEYYECHREGEIEEYRDILRYAYA